MIPDASYLSYKTYFPVTSQPVVTGTLKVYQVRLANQQINHTRPWYRDRIHQTSRTFTCLSRLRIIGVAP
jgi:hypothetical protein